MTEPPTSSDLTRIVQDALNQPEPWPRRILNLARRLPATLARMGGYWGGVTMRWRNKP